MRVPSLALAALALIPATLAGQREFTIEARPNFVVPTGKLAGASLETGPAFGAIASIRLQPHLHLYGGWDWARFEAASSFAGPDRSFEQTGYSLGLRFEHPCPRHPALALRVEGGGTWQHVEIENSAGEIIADSKHSTGYEAGAGAALSLGDDWKLVPMARYRSLSPKFTIGSTTTFGNLRYVGAELALSRSFR
jgi:hypothetical protein